MEKTVYILGAGFSKEAGAPLQNQLIGEAFELEKVMLKKPKGKELEDFQKHFKIFKDFIEKQLHVSGENFSNVNLEDIFSPLDRCLSENSQYRGISLEEIMTTRKSISYIISKTIQNALNAPNKDKEYINEFARYLVEKSFARIQKKYREIDPISVISTNWDILLDNSIYNELVNNKKFLNNDKNDDDDGRYKGVVDYCCYISSMEKDDVTIKPGLEKLGQGGFNVKLLKLHGSLNWMQCPRCARLYTGFNQKTTLYAFEHPSSCRHCDKNFEEELDKHQLSSNLIMPTYLKNLSNPQYKIIWQNAGIEISEATEIVFIGYSLPAADYDLRQLLSRMTRKNAKIHVVDYVESEKENCKDLENEIKNRWRHFFGKREIEFYFNGAKAYVEELV